MLAQGGGDEGAALIGGDLLNQLLLGLEGPLGVLLVLGRDALVAVVALGTDVGDQLDVRLDVGQLLAAFPVG